MVNKNIYVQYIVLHMKTNKNRNRNRKTKKTYGGAPEIINYENGDIYQGDVDSNRKRHGNGKMTYQNGNIYDGGWKNDSFDGQGILIYTENAPNNTYNYSKYEGEWKNGKMHGEGKMTFQDKRIYEGDWEDDEATCDSYSVEGDWRGIEWYCIDGDDEMFGYEEDEETKTKITNDNIKALIIAYLYDKDNLPDDLKTKIIGDWDVSNVTNMESLFDEATTFNESLNDWNVSNVENMKRMFRGAESFNQPLNKWDVSNVTNMEALFNSATTFNQPLNDWNVSKVKNMQFMFRSAESFNQPLNKWDVSKVKNMQFMFNNAKKFNQPINNWNISKVENMLGMFRDAESFNHDNLSQQQQELRQQRDLRQQELQQELRRLQERRQQQESQQFLQNELRQLESQQLLHEMMHHQERKNVKQYDDIENEPLINKELTIDVTTEVRDLMTLDDVKIGDYLSSDKDNLCFVSTNADKQTYYLSNRNNISPLIRDGNIIKYSCNKIGTSIVPRIENIITDTPLFSLSSIGITIGGYVKLAQIKEIITNETIQIINITDSGIPEYPSVASLQMFGPNPDAVGATHCQEGQNGKLYTMENITPILVGGGRRRRKKSIKKRICRKSKKTSRRL